MIEDWRVLAEGWRLEEANVEDVRSVEHYLSQVKLRQKWAYLNWAVSKVSVGLVYCVGIYAMVSAFSWAGLAFFMGLGSVATLATLTSDPRFLGLQKTALERPETYRAAQERVIRFRLRSALCNIVIGLLLVALTFWMDRIDISLANLVQIEPIRVRYVVLVGIAYETWRLRKFSRMQARLERSLSAEDAAGF